MPLFVVSAEDAYKEVFFQHLPKPNVLVQRDQSIVPRGDKQLLRLKDVSSLHTDDTKQDCLSLLCAVSLLKKSHVKYNLKI